MLPDVPVTPEPGARPLEKPGGEDEKAMFTGVSASRCCGIVSQCDALEVAA